MKRLLLLLVVFVLCCGIVSGAALDHKYDLKLLIHADAADLFNDSSRYFAAPYPMINSTSIPTGVVNINTTQKKYGESSLFFSGPMSNVTIADNDVFTFGNSNHSVCAWVYWPYVVQEAKLFYHQTDVNNYDLYSVSSSSAIQIQHYRSGSSVGSNAVSTGTIYPGLWNQICIIKNGTVSTAYFNGTALATTATQTGSYTDLTGPVRIGDSNGYFPSHYIDEVTLTNGGLAPSITDLNSAWPLYLNGTAGGYADDNSTVSLLHFNGANDGTVFRDQYGNRTWTATGAVVTATNISKFAPSSYYGTAGQISSAPSSNFDFGTSDFTIEAWIKPTTISVYQYVFAATDGTTNGYGIIIDNTGKIYVASNASGTWQIDFSASSAITANVFSHIALVRNGSIISFYKDGTRIGQKTGIGGYQYNTYGNIPTISKSSFPFKGNIDELRISKGLARWTANFTPPTTPYELIENNGFTATPDASGTAPVTVQFNDTTPSSAWTTNTWNWSFGDTGYSSSQNPSHVFTTTGIYNLTQTVMNNNMSVTYADTMQVGAPNVDFSATPVSGTAALTVTFSDLTTNTTPITAYLIDFGDGTTSTELPPWTHVYSTYGAFTVNLTETNSIGTGYENKRDYVVVSTEQGNLVESYTPWDVRIRIVDYYGKPLPGTTVTANYVASTLPNTSTNWLTKAFSIDADVAADMVNSAVAYTGSTDDTGGLSFSMFKNIQYRLTITNTTSGVSSTKTIYPSDQEYVVYVRTTGQVANNNTLSTRTAALPWYSLNTTHISLNVSYKDTTGCTSGLLYRVWFRDNGTEVHNESQSGSTGWINDSHIITKAPIGTEYLWSYNATTIC